MRIFKMVVFVPEEYLEKMMDSVTEAISPVYPNYTRTFSYSKVTGTWLPLEGSDPFLGTHGKIETAEETRLEFIVFEKDIKAAVKAVRGVHPYEEPAIDIIETLDWHSL